MSWWIIVCIPSPIAKTPSPPPIHIISSHTQAKADELGHYFFDRDPTHFRLLLNYLRSGKVILPESKMALQELLFEAEFFCIEEMREAVQRALGGLKFEDNFLYFMAGQVWLDRAEGMNSYIRTFCSIDTNNKDRKVTYEGR